VKLALPRGARTDAAAFAIGLIVLTVLLVFLSDGSVLFSRPLWADEIQTMMVASHASPVAVLSDLVHGVDHGPPLLHLTVWIADRLGLVSTVTLRWMALLCVLGSLVFVYATLRRQWSRGASAAATLAVGANALVVAQAFEARYYGLWLLFTAMFAWCIAGPQPASRRRRDVAIAVIAVLLCVAHWYGVITLSLMCAGVLLSYGRRWRDGARVVLPSLAGFVALAACVPLALRQRASLTINTWVPDFDLRQLDTMAQLFWAAFVPALAVALLLIAAMISARRDGAYRFGSIAGRAARDPGIVALASLTLLPIALAVVSWMGQPSLFPRYAIPAALAWAPLVGLALELAGRWTARAFVVLLVGVWFANFVRLSQLYRNFALRTELQTTQLEQARATGLPVVFQSMHTMYAVTARNWPRHSSASFLELPDSTLSVLFPAGLLYQLNKGSIIERDIVRVHSRRYGYPTIVPRGALDTVPRFVVVFDETEFPRGYSPDGFAQAVFPRHKRRRVSSDLWLFEAAIGGR
jgi:hypothetical protein